MNGILKNGGKLFIRTVFINLMCFFVVMSFITFAVAVFAQDVGYVAYGSKDASKSGEKLYTYYSADGADTKLAEYEAQGYTVTKRTIREVGKTADTITKIVAQGFAIAILITFIYPKLWDQGNLDRNLVHINREKEDVLKGLKIGLIGAAPSILIFLFLAMTKNGLSKEIPVSLHKMLNASLYPLSEAIMGKATVFCDLSVLQLILMGLSLLIVPAVAFAGYYLGYRGFSIGEKLTYKGTK